MNLKICKDLNNIKIDTKMKTPKIIFTRIKNKILNMKICKDLIVIDNIKIDMKMKTPKIIFTNDLVF